MKTLFGPFVEILTMSNLSLKGPLFDDDLEIIYDGGVIVDRESIVEVGKFSKLKEKCKNVYPCYYNYKNNEIS